MTVVIKPRRAARIRRQAADDFRLELGRELPHPNWRVLEEHVYELGGFLDLDTAGKAVYLPGSLCTMQMVRYLNICVAENNLYDDEFSTQEYRAHLKAQMLSFVVDSTPELPLGLPPLKKPAARSVSRRPSSGKRNMRSRVLARAG
jgi:hypothetical protein